MKNKRLIIILILAIVLFVLGFIANYIDKGRVSTGHEPKFTIKIVTDGGNKITYWGLGYKVVRYPSVSPNEPYKNSLGIKMGSWFMNYELSNYESISIELLTEGKKIEITRTRDIESIISLLRDSKYINEVCDGINTHKIIVEDEVYYLKESCKEIQKGKKQANISVEDLNSFLKIIETYYENYSQNPTKENLENDKKVNFIRTYKVIADLKKTDETGEYNYYVIEQYQLGEPIVIKILSKYKLQENINYEFSFEGNKKEGKEYSIKEIFNTFEIVKIEETDKKAMEQIQDEI